MNRIRLSLLSLFALAFMACDSGSSSNSEAYDCTMTEEGVKVFFPEGGESFNMGDTITVIFGANYANAGGFRVLYKADVDSNGVDLSEESVGPDAPEGSECYEVSVALSADMGVIASEKAFIRVQAYNSAATRGDSKTFVVKE
jgi:hypothetical protein